MHETRTMLQMWIGVLSVAWKERRTEAGGVSDETAMIGLMLMAASAVGLIVLGVVSGAANRLGGLFDF